MSDKQLVIDAVSRLPEATTIDDIREEIEILAAINRGQEAAAAGKVIPHEEVKKLVANGVQNSLDHSVWHAARESPSFED